jgi:hypothetical protein
MAAIDVKRLASEVSAQHGIRLDPDDPIMAVVTLNQLVFEQYVSVVVDRIARSVQEFEQAADKVQARAGIVLAQEVRDCVVSFRREMREDVESASARPNAKSGALGDMLSMVAVRRWIAVVLVFAAGLFSAGVWLGACLR